jgi:hypothetical protein
MTAHVESRPAAPADTRRALGLELTLQRPLLWGCGVVALVVLLLAVGQIAGLGVVPLLLAVMAPIGAGPRDAHREALLRGGLGVSRAAHVLARTRIVLGLQLVLLAVTALTILMGPHSVEEPSVVGPWSVAGITVMLPTTSFWSDALMFCSAVLWSHLWVGRDALRSSSTLMWARALVSYLGMWVVTGVVAGALTMALVLGSQWIGADVLFEHSMTIGLILSWAVMLGGVLIALHRRSRVWAATA